ncbi:CheW protein [Stanieria cyanosphaera PCC 7437]|uniref:CheW protein n=1 Tax=Stanieria cyanosphaera (strain ATCC 29371 / PCC 7437) TaxID=111780 RepID=K9XW53_STAC7|nr:chemotaxis protein CheW [Stanieria cyanosphaera]AFZ36299.1 CheW protein [Stanieria cyanosphaera PCC 7437]
MLSLSQSNSLALNLGIKTNNSSNRQRLRKFLQFQLAESKVNRALLEAELVTEIITISSTEILPVPQMLYCVLGIYSWRSEMLWIVDLENLLGYPSVLFSDAAVTEAKSLMTMIVQFQGQALGLVVSAVDNIVQLDLEEFKSPSPELFSNDVLPFLSSYFNSSHNEIMMLLDTAEIFHFFNL